MYIDDKISRAQLAIFFFNLRDEAEHMWYDNIYRVPVGFCLLAIY